MEDDTKGTVAIIALAIIGIIIIIGGLMWAIPTYHVWSNQKAGEASLVKAQQEKQIQISQAQAELEASQYQAQAIKTVGEMTKEYPSYREQQFIQDFGEAMKNGNIQKIIYVPTEANLPITEAKTDNN